MDAPPEKENVRPFARIARHLRNLGFAAPEILGEDAVAGLLLLEDFGDDTFTRLIARSADSELDLYALAVDVLACLHRLPARAAIPPGLPEYDQTRLLDEACLLTDWYLPAISGEPLSEGARREYVAAWCTTFPIVLAAPPTLVLRDFHVDNLMRIAGRQGVTACGLLDFQDAVAGPAAYDLMSLLEDARRDISAELKAEMIERYRNAVPDLDWRVYSDAFAVLAAQRHAKVIGIFTRLFLRDGKPGYLVHIPRVWRLLEAALPHPVLAPVAAWFARHVPHPLRRAPLCQNPAH
jgi:hypothetical protein